MLKAVWWDLRLASLLTHWFLNVFCLFVRLRISQRRKNIEASNYARVLAYYPDRSSPILQNFGSRGVMRAALLSRMYAATDWIKVNRMVHAVRIGVGGVA